MTEFSEHQLIDWRRELHSPPELSGHEVETTARLRRWLQDAGVRLLHHGSFNPDEALIAPAAHYFALLAQHALQHLNARCCDAILNPPNTPND